MLPERLAYHRLETDDEFRRRAFPTQNVIVHEFVEMITGYYGMKYPDKRSEVLLVKELAGQKLDDVAWQVVKMQRRILFIPA